MTKICRNCEKEKNLSEFYSTARDGHQPDCKDCYNKIRKKHNKKRRERARVRKTEKKDRAIEYLGGCCKRCGDKFIGHPEVFDFHHINPEEKEAESGEIIYYSWKRAKVELDKCMLLCSNCHRILHKESYYAD